ncbi:S-adenosyl-L-methionine-dependent methyltransferase [Xylariomycetidae sp. FL2044]|nr:S-adenosyl-L-methionine-dependent methyltransferase [Xylariomycetidae sp. FL2044]
MADAQKSSSDFISAAQSVLATGDENARKQMFGAAMQAMSMLESPLDTVWRIIMSPHAPAALMTLIKAGVIQEIAKSDSPSSADHLASVSGADRLLIVRLMRPLNALGIVKETSQEEYAPTPITKTLVDRALLGGYQFMFSAATRSLANMPFYLEKTGFKHVGGAPGPFQDAHHTQDNMFPWLVKDPPMMGNFNAFMTGQRADRKQWFDFFSVDEILLQGARTDPSGGRAAGQRGRRRRVRPRRVLQAVPRRPRQARAPGHAAGHRQHPGAHAPDRAAETRLLRAPAGERRPGSPLTRDVIIGARCYYFRSIFHDWPDAECIKIMKNIAEAMTPGYSKLLMSEFVLPASNTPLYPALLDVNMMTLLNGMERTEAQFSRLLDAAGLKVVKFWSVGAEVEGLVEAVLKD